MWLEQSLARTHEGALVVWLKVVTRNVGVFGAVSAVAYLKPLCDDVTTARLVDNSRPARGVCKVVGRVVADNAVSIFVK
jgi:hypothetical protein